jgi:hypothetical protein
MAKKCFVAYREGPWNGRILERPEEFPTSQKSTRFEMLGITSDFAALDIKTQEFEYKIGRQIGTHEGLPLYESHYQGSTYFYNNPHFDEALKDIANGKA